MPDNIEISEKENELDEQSRITEKCQEQLSQMIDFLKADWEGQNNS